jgi:hypothetical protein
MNIPEKDVNSLRRKVWKELEIKKKLYQEKCGKS